MKSALFAAYFLLCVAIVVGVPPLVVPYVEVYGVITVFDSGQAVLLCTALATIAAVYAYKQGDHGSFLLKLFLAAIIVASFAATRLMTAPFLAIARDSRDLASRLAANRGTEAPGV